MKDEIDCIIQELLNNKSECVTVVNTNGHDHPIADYIVIASVSNVIHLQSLSDAVARFYKKNKQEKFEALDYFGMCGTPESGWVILDFNTLIIHVMTKDSRDHYNFDGIFKDYEILNYY